MKVGCNYWASHAGVRMWSQWNETVVRQDFERMAEAGIQSVRVFPLWPDFQPLELAAGCQNRPRLLQFRGGPLPDTPCGRDGVDEQMVQRFRTLATIAAEHRLELIVGLVTGWMSGQLFLPQAFAGLDPLRSPLSIKWQIRLVRCLVRELRDLPAIAVWEPGNESNCMGEIATPQEAWNWTNAITAAIRAEDATRPVASGMHGLMPGADTEFGSELPWTIETQGELCDLLTPHPYPHSMSKLPARVDPHTSIRAAFQATVELRFYSDLGGKPAFVEEIGTFAPSYCNEQSKAEFLRNSMFNAWAHGSSRFLWWCAFEQSMLEHSPYSWSAWERELGLYDARFRLRPVGEEMRKFRTFLDALPFRELPPFRRDAVCLLTREQDFNAFMANGWSSFLLAKQAGFDLEFRFVADGVGRSSLYFVPGIRGGSWSFREEFLALLEEVRQGATLFLTIDDGALAPFESVFGASVRSREMRSAPVRFRFGGELFELNAPFRLELCPREAEVLACEEDGNPVFLRNAYGRGTVYLLTVPLERELAGRPGAFHRPEEPKWFRFYQTAAEREIGERILQSCHPLITLTEHRDPPEHAWIVAVNNHSETLSCDLKSAAGWQPAAPLPDFIAPHTGILLEYFQA